MSAQVVRIIRSSAIILTASILVICPLIQTVVGQDQVRYALGDEPVPADQYAKTELTFQALDAIGQHAWDLNTIPEFDARDRGWVTTAKNQGACGGCWSFAVVGTIESRVLKDGGPRLDLSEQQQISCNHDMRGCCGGSGTSLMFYYTHRPLLESEAGYAEASTSCPTEHSIDCESLSGSGAPYLANGFYTVQQTVEAFKLSVLNHGPSYFRFDVYGDFFTYWNTAAAGSVYKQSAGSLQGGHAVLLIGWSESKRAFLLKNSWSTSGGPNHDGTFWLAYDGHINDLRRQMFNIVTLTHVTVPTRDTTVRPLVRASENLPNLRRGDATTLSVVKAPVLAEPPTDNYAVQRPFTADEGYLESFPIDADLPPEKPTDEKLSRAGFSWYNNCRVNGNSTLLGTSGTTQISVFAQDVSWRYAFNGPVVTTPTGNGGTAGNGWRFPAAHRFGIVIYQGNNYWNVTSTSSSNPTVISGISNTQPIVVTVNDTINNFTDNGGAIDIYVRKDN